MSPLSDRLRRATTLVLVVAALVLGPQLAFATFGSSTAAPALSVGTATMVAPTGVTGTYKCSVQWSPLRDQLEVDVKGFTDSGPAGATYVYTLIQDGETVNTITSPNRSAKLVGQVRPDVTRTVWDLTVTMSLGGWTSPAYRRTITCPVFNTGGTASGNL